jgi:hypothetical protein
MISHDFFMCFFYDVLCTLVLHIPLSCCSPQHMSFRYGYLTIQSTLNSHIVLVSSRTLLISVNTFILIHSANHSIGWHHYIFLLRFFRKGYFVFVLQATPQTKQNKMFLPQPVEGSFFALKKPSPFCFPSLILSGQNQQLQSDSHHHLKDINRKGETKTIVSQST